MTTYQGAYDGELKTRNASMSPIVASNSTHKTRYINRPYNDIQGPNQLAYVKGKDFNSQQKYDFDIVNNDNRGTLRHAASSSLLLPK